MLFHTHILFGIFLFLLSKPILSGNIYVVFVLVLLGSMLPDIDEHKSKITQWSGGLGKVISYLFRHRGILHSIVTPVILCVLLGLLNKNYALALFIGYMGHLFADSLTLMGIPILYPFTEFRLRGFLKTARIGEWVIFVLLVIGILMMIL